MSHPLKVDPAVLQAAASDFDVVGSAVAVARIGPNVGDAASGLGALRTGEVLERVATRVDEACDTVAAAHRAFAADVRSAAERYATTDADEGGKLGTSIDAGG